MFNTKTHVLYKIRHIFSKFLCEVKKLLKTFENILLFKVLSVDFIFLLNEANRCTLSIFKILS